MAPQTAPAPAFLIHGMKPSHFMHRMRHDPADLLVHLRATAPEGEFDTNIKKAFADPQFVAGLNQHIVDDADALTAKVVQLERDFSDIGDLLYKVDNANIQGDKFLPTWISLRDEFRTILLASKDSATNLSAFCQRHVSIYLPRLTKREADGGLSLAEKHTLIDTLVKSFDPQVTEAEAQMTKFQTLADKVHDFSRTFDTYGQQAQADDKKTLDDLELQMIEVKAKIDALNKKMTGLAVGLGGSVFASITAVAGCAAVFPEAVPFVILAGIATAGTLLGLLIDTIKDLSAARRDKNDIEAKQNEVKAHQQLVSTSMAQLAQAKDKTASVHDALGMFKSIWEGLREELQIIQKHLTSDDGGLETILLDILHVSGQMYDQLRQALDRYVMGITNSNVPAPPATPANGAA